MGGTCQPETILSTLDQKVEEDCAFSLMCFIQTIVLGKSIPLFNLNPPPAPTPHPLSSPSLPVPSLSLSKVSFFPSFFPPVPAAPYIPSASAAFHSTNWTLSQPPLSPFLPPVESRCTSSPCSFFPVSS